MRCALEPVSMSLLVSTASYHTVTSHGHQCLACRGCLIVNHWKTLCHLCVCRCPQGIARKGHYGAFLMEDWDLVSSLIRSLHEGLSVPVTCKIRVFDDREKTIQYAKMIEASGCQV